MELINQFKKTIEEWLKPLPHLPVTWRKWLGENLWWLTLVGVIISVISIFILILAILAALSIFGAAATVYNAYGVAVTTTYSGFWILSSFVSLALLMLTVALTAMAVSPLKAQKQKGWDLLFLVFVINIISSLISALIKFNAFTLIPSLIGAAISAAISAYFLFEVRSQFNGATVIKK